MYEVHLSSNAEKFLKKLDQNLSERIIERLKRLSDDPVPPDSKFIERSSEGKIFRYRIGEYRAIYQLKDIEKVVLITTIEHRSKIYSKYILREEEAQYSTQPF